MSKNVEIKGYNELLQKLDAIGADVPLSVKQALKGGSLIISKQAKNYVKTDTGRLKNTIFTQVEVEGDTATATIGTNTKYAPYVEFGTGTVGETTATDLEKYTKGISYKQNKWRVFIPDVGVRWIAGMKARPFLWPAYLKEKDAFVKYVADDLKRTLNKYSKAGGK